MCHSLAFPLLPLYNEALECVAVQHTLGALETKQSATPCLCVLHIPAPPLEGGQVFTYGWCDCVFAHACVAVCCGVLQCVAVCCSLLQCVAVCCSVLQCVAVRCSVLQCVAVY